MHIHVETHGSGKPLLFLGGSSWDLRFDRVAFDWAPRASVTAFDQRGLGQTDTPSTAWAMADYVADAARVMAGHKRFDVVGYSFGSMVAQHLAAKMPDRINRLALIAAGPGGDLNSYPLHELAELPLLERARKIIAIQDIRKEGKVSDVEVDRMVANIKRKAAVSPKDGPTRLLAVRAAHDARAVLASVRCPTWVIGGRHDGQAPRDIVEALAGLIPDARLMLMPGGHTFVLDPDGPLQALARLWDIT
ncbi:alpha/beta hydrolase [Yoonia sp. F2084L]|uniref:alpha/beta fold hydrolase n=1 Tax=Yoonia sp. F2084L TaxID=2926419 RepID=UPI001FF23716|nr:alpha/beta hydrolase [Yoonia sp. F2084L]MCK0096721.1 alpha/beta hydrolase [Yoonia sp. F2084L]